MYCIAPSSFHGLGLFSMDVIKVDYGTITELMEYVRPLYRYNNWLILVQYTRSMRRYRVATNYIQLVEHNKNKGETMYIDGRPKVSRNVAGFVNSTWTMKTTKQPNCDLEGCKEHRIFVCATKTILPGEELLIDYNLNQIDVASMVRGNCGRSHDMPHCVNAKYSN